MTLVTWSDFLCFLIDKTPNRPSISTMPIFALCRAPSLLDLTYVLVSMLLVGEYVFPPFWPLILHIPSPAQHHNNGRHPNAMRLDDTWDLVNSLWFVEPLRKMLGLHSGEPIAHRKRERGKTKGITWLHRRTHSAREYSPKEDVFRAGIAPSWRMYMSGSCLKNNNLDL